MKRKIGKHAIKFTGESKTQQQFKDETNINNIMARYEKTGLIDHLNNRAPNYGDFTEVDDYQSAVNKIMLADEYFMELPAKIRAHFNNNPAEFLEFTENPENMDAMIEMGLAYAPEPPPEVAEPSEPEITPQAPPEEA